MLKIKIILVVVDIGYESMIHSFSFLTLLCLPGDASMVISCTLALKLQVGDDGEEEVVLAGVAGKQAINFGLVDEGDGREGLDDEVI